MNNGPEFDNEIEIDLKDLFMEILAFWELQPSCMCFQRVHP